MEDRLRLIQWLSPAFPIGSFAYSQGLEQVMAEGTIRNAADVEVWLRDVLRFGSPQMDAVFVAQAMAGADPDMLSDLIRALASSAERDIELMEQGRAFTALMSEIRGENVSIRPYPVAVGLALRGLDVTVGEALALFLQGSAAQMISAATRFLPLGQSQAQAILARLAPLIAGIATRAAATPLDEIATFTPGADMAMMMHETLDVRIFRT
ncbi:urease accessory protein UreF [Gemmobacter serpentinus]|uniref:urease accessory protein UreF n=1 Tax=Gemmobacter serpentinus TaxID=2652247 RepID=UPI00124E29F6|nr:urease accessory UreF family protein [Gemmobacter serpentinus]